MNYLAHLYLGRKSDASMVGNFLGDFAKGNEEALAKEFPPAVVDGILMHRKIDKFTDAHPCFHETKILLSSHISRYAGIIVDIIFDHFLAKHWDTYGEGSLDEFVNRCHQTLEKHPEWQNEALKEKLPLIIESDLLRSYREKIGIKNSLERMAKRSERIAPIADGYADFERNYDEFEKIFHEFFPALQRYVASIEPAADLNTENTAELSDEDLILMWKQQAITMAERGFYKESIINHFRSKGVSDDEAKRASEEIIANVEKKKKTASKYLLYPGIFLFALLPFILFMGLIIPHELTANHGRNAIGAVFVAIMGSICISKSKAVR